MYGWNQILVRHDDLLDFAWSAPKRDLAARVGLSDVGLKKLLKSNGVVTPPQGYWNKVHAGKPVPKRPKAPPRRAGKTGRIALDERFASVVTPTPPLSSAGPFASVMVPEDLDDLFAQELTAVGHAAVRKRLDRVHPGLVQLLKQEERRREKFAVSGWSWDAPKFDAALDQRRLRILNALFLALARREHRGEVYEHDGELHAKAVIGDTHIGLRIDVAGKHATVQIRGCVRAARDLPAKTPLAIRADPNFEGKTGEVWQDDASGALETRIAEIAARIIVAGEAKFRRGLKEAEERAEQFRLAQEKRRQEQVEACNRERLKQLRESGELLRQAQDLRALVAEVRAAVIAGSVDVEQARLEAWEEWASAEADRLDPIVSGQIMTHLAPQEDGG